MKAWETLGRRNEEKMALRGVRLRQERTGRTLAVLSVQVGRSQMRSYSTLR